MKRPNFNQRGFTLVELTFVIAIIVVLVSILLPTLFSQIEGSKRAKADVDLQEIGAALMSFFNDLDHFPTCESTTDCSSISNTNNNLRFLAFGEGFGDLSANYPSESGVTWNLSTSDEASAAKNNGANHLVINDPVLGTDGASTDYDSSGKKKWRGAYLSRVGLDPWTKTYIAYVGAMETSGTTLSGVSGTQRGWIISGGENGALETSPSSTSLGSDDHGYILK